MSTLSTQYGMTKAGHRARGTTVALWRYLPWPQSSRAFIWRCGRDMNILEYVFEYDTMKGEDQESTNVITGSLRNYRK